MRKIEAKPLKQSAATFTAIPAYGNTYDLTHALEQFIWTWSREQNFVILKASANRIRFILYRFNRD